MPNKLLDMLRDRHDKVKAAREIVERAQAEKRDLTADERAKFDGLTTAAIEQGKDIERIQSLDALEHNLEVVRETVRTETSVEAESRALDARDRIGRASLSDEQRKVVDGVAMRGLEKWVRRQGMTQAEVRGLEITDLTKGGYLRPPKQFVDDLLKNVDDLLWMRRLGRVMQIGEAESLGVLSLDTDYADADWTQEVPSSITEDSALRLGNRELSPHQLAKLVKVSKKMMKNPSFDIVGFIRSRFAYKFALTQEKTFLTGSGAQQPLGVFTASAQGISTSRDVSTGNAQTAMTYSGLKAAKYALKAQYRNSNSIAWLFHRDGIAQLAKIVDGEGRFMWQDSVVLGEPDRLFGYPVYESENAPNTFTSGLYVGLLGDWSYFWIVDAGSLNIQQLVELYAGSLQDGFVGTMWSDAQPVLEEAFVRVKLG